MSLLHLFGKRCLRYLLLESLTSTFSFPFCRFPKCENPDAETRDSWRRRNHRQRSNSQLETVLFIYLLFLNGLFADEFVVYNSLLLLVMYSAFSHVSCCFILFMLSLMFTCSTVSWSMQNLKKQSIKLSQNYQLWEFFLHQ